MGTDSGRRRGWGGAAALAVIVVALIVGVAVFGLVRDPGDGSENLGPSNTRSSSWSTTEPRAPRPLGLLETANAAVFARRVALALFTWDTTRGAAPTDYAQVFVDVGDPTGTETAGLASDVRSYLPTPEQWAQLSRYRTRQWLIIDALSVPEAWDDAQQQAAPGQLLPGTPAYTVTGTRHRIGTWDGDPVEADQEVAFTIFLTCRPSFEHCRLLRLSELNNPLH